MIPAQSQSQSQSQSPLELVRARLLKVHADAGVAGVLEHHDFTSAMAIAGTARGQFVDTVAPSLGGDRAFAGRLHDRASQIRVGVMHGWANVRTAIASPHYNALRIGNVSDELRAAFQTLPDYEELFGALDYCSCDECRSIFGAAAYLVDLQRVIDTYVTAPNTIGPNPTPTEFLFASRRPDIGEIALTCANTNETFPLLRIVNQRLAAMASTYLALKPGDDLYAALTGITYPFALPFNLQAERITLALAQIGVALADVYAVFGASADAVAQASFGLSAQSWAFVTTSLASDTAKLAVSWGVATSALPGLAQADRFEAATGLDTVALMALLAQGLSAAEIDAGVSAGFFINAGLGDGTWLAYDPGDDTTPAGITGMGATPAVPLDRLSRFIRLAALLGLDAGALDWALRVTGAPTAQIASGVLPPADVTAASLAALARAVRLGARAGLVLPTILMLLGPVKPYGAGDGSVSAVPFDVLFNAGGGAPYHPATPLNPLYEDAIATWTIGDTSAVDQALASFVAAGIGVSQAVLATLGTALWGGEAAVPLSLENLSALNRHAILLRHAGLTAGDYLKLARRAGAFADTSLACVLSPDQLDALLADIAWLSGAGLSIDQIDYALGAAASPAVDPLFQVTALPGWLATVIQTSAPLAKDMGSGGRVALDAVLFGQLATMFGVQDDLIAAAHPLALAAAPLPFDGPPTWEAAFTTPPIAVGDPPPYLEYVTAYVTALSRWLVVVTGWSLPSALVASIARNPAAYGLDATRIASLDFLRWLSAFRQLTLAYSDTAGRFMTFVDPPAGAASSAVLLAAATGWDPAQTAALLGPVSADPNRVAVATTVAARVALLARIGCDPTLPPQLIALLVDPATAWADLTALADLVMSTVQARVGTSQWPAIATQLEGAIAERERSVLAPYVLAQIQLTVAGITTLRNLSEYLLLDVEVSGVLQISYVREALNAAQLYLQRCRLRLEPIKQLAIPEIWWEWLMNYRLWEANRQVFLYPENYIDPTLRKSATPLFQSLETKLLQDAVTVPTVETAYRTYLDGLIALAALDYVDAYHCTVDDPVRGPVDTSFYFARTSTDPYRFSMISYDSNVWSSWQPIDVTIPAPLITPVYVFKRLYLFWVELKRTKDSAADATVSTPQGITYQATIKCTFADSNGQWIQPQVVVADQLVYYMPSAANQQGAMGPWADRPDLFQMDDLFWNKVSLTVVDADAAPADQRLVMLYGPLLSQTAGAQKRTPPPVPATQTNMSASDLIFAQQIFALTNNYNELLTSNADAYLPVVGALVLDRDLNASFIRRPNERVIFERDYRENAPPLFRPELETLFGTLMLATADCAYVADYLTDYIPAIGTARSPAPVSVADFQTDTITAQAAQAIFNDLVGNNVVIGVTGGIGRVAISFGANPDLSFLFGGTPSAQTDPMIPVVRSILLDLVGDPTLFATAPIPTSRTISVKNQPGRFLFATGDETFLITPRDTSYAELSAATGITIPIASPYVFPDFFKTVSAAAFLTIFNDLAGNNVVVGVVDNPGGTPIYGQLTPGFSAQTDLSFLFGGAPLATQAALISQVRRILLNLPTLTMLSYQGNALPRFVLPTSFITADITAAGSQSIFNDLVGNNIITSAGGLNGEFSETTSLSFLFGGTPQPKLEAEVRAVLLLLPKFVQPTSFVSVDRVAPITVAESQGAFTALVANQVMDAQGLVGLGFAPSIDLGYLYPAAAAPVRALMIAATRAVLQRFYDANYRTDVNEMRFAAERISARTSAHELSYVLRGGGIDALLSLDSQNAPIVPKAPFDRFKPVAGAMLTPPTLFDAAQVDFDGPYGLYYWEMFFHTPMLVSGALAANQQFADAKAWLEYILDPTVAETFVEILSLVTADIAFDQASAAYQALIKGGLLDDLGAGNARVTAAFIGLPSLPDLFPTVADPSQHALMMREVANVLGNFQVAIPAAHYWQFRPFRNHTLESLLATLTDPAQIAIYNDDPFDPHAIARLRIGAYEKTTLMKYLDVLIAWGDMLFTEFTWESITAATLLYMYAGDLLGARPENLGPCPTPTPMTFNQIKALNPGGIPQFLIALESALPAPTGSVYAVDGQPFNAIDAYFCVPENATLIGYWDTVENRLTKIRNGLNINGMPQALALFDPPIDPMALVRLAASGSGGLSIAAAAGSAAVSDYRFGPLLDQAAQLAAMVTELGGVLLAALEKQDAGQLDTLRARQESQILQLSTGMKQRAIDDVTASLASLTTTRDKAQFQADYYAGLTQSGLSGKEIATAGLQFSAMFFSAFSGPIHGISIVGYLSPSIFGLADGGMKWGDAVNVGAQIADSVANTLNLAAAMTAAQGEFDRRDEDWQFQAQLALRDVVALDSQIVAAGAQLAAAQLDLAITARAFDQAQAVASFLTQKFTSTQLYQWMVARTSALYFQAYTLALDAARKAELAYQYELNATDTFIGFSYWNSLNKGLLAGETLGYSLGALRKAYSDRRTRTLQVEKTVSLMQLDPLQVLRLQSGLPATFALTETMFDLDFPGHYQRQIASIAITLPALVGPYQNVSATLIQEKNDIVMVADPAVVDYLVKRDQGKAPSTIPAGLRQNWKVTQEIAVSHGTSDTGSFELSFGGDLFMPFEGTGAVSRWMLAIPPENNRIDLSTITDVVIDIRYTALDGGSTFDGAPSFRTLVLDTLRSNDVRFADLLYLDAPTMLPSDWFAFMNPETGAATQVLSIAVTSAMFPYLPTIRLDQVTVRLVTAAGITIPAANAFATLAIGGSSDALDFAPVGAAPANAPEIYVAVDPRTRIAGPVFLATWALTVTLADVPAALLKNGMLDPAALLGVEFLLAYSADVLPPP